MAELPDVTWAIPFALKEHVYSSGLNLQVSVRENTDRRSLDARTDLHNYSATFDWGSNNAGAAQLSLALLADALDSDARAQSIHQTFMSRVVVDLPPPDTDPYVRWCGRGGVVRLPPIPIAFARSGSRGDLCCGAAQKIGLGNGSNQRITTCPRGYFGRRPIVRKPRFRGGCQRFQYLIA